MMITLEIEAISTTVVYAGSSFSIDLPYHLFSGNTEGQCGELLQSLWSAPNLEQVNLVKTCLLLCALHKMFALVEFKTDHFSYCRKVLQRFS